MTEELKMRDDRPSPPKISLNYLCEQAISLWGFDTQMDMVIEEMSELTKAILKYRRDPTMARAQHISEELSDVKIMLRQVDVAMLQRFPGFDEWQKKETYSKLFRLQGMLERCKEK